MSNRIFRTTETLNLVEGVDNFGTLERMYQRDIIL